MGYSAEVVQRARARLAQAKEDRESENRQHLAEAYAKARRENLSLQQERAALAAANFEDGFLDESPCLLYTSPSPRD